MVLNLYRFDGSALLFWQAWEDDDGVVINAGAVGEGGETVTLPVPEGSSPDSLIGELAAERRAAGYAAREDEELTEVVVQFPVEGWGASPDLDVREAVSFELSEALGWTGNGHVDGGDIGSGTINIVLFTVDAARALESIKNALWARGWLAKAVIAVVGDDEEPAVVWPTDFAGEFSY